MITKGGEAKCSPCSVSASPSESFSTTGFHSDPRGRRLAALPPLRTESGGAIYYYQGMTFEEAIAAIEAERDEP